jgi:hypothetical protein
MLCDFPALLPVAAAFVDCPLIVESCGPLVFLVGISEFFELGLTVRWILGKGLARQHCLDLQRLESARQQLTFILTLFVFKKTDLD